MGGDYMEKKKKKKVNQNLDSTWDIPGLHLLILPNVCCGMSDGSVRPLSSTSRTAALRDKK